MYLKSYVAEDNALGMCFYAINSDLRIAHRIKHVKDSFKVEELIDSSLLCRDGELYVYRLYKNWGIDSDKLSQYLNKYGLKLLGRKDKYSTSIQYAVSKKRLSNSKFEYIGKIPGGIKTSELHIGNKFVINIFVENLNSRFKDIKELVEEDAVNQEIPNYFSYQRFGVERKNHVKGFQIIKYLADGFQNKSKKFFKDRKRLGYYINAFQSYIFNLALSLEIKESSRLPNKHYIYLKDLTGKNVKISAYPVPGYSIIEIPYELEGIMSKIGIKLDDLKKYLYQLKNMGIDTFGDLRSVKIYFLIKPEVEKLNDNEIKLEFAISRGQYGTQVLREIFKPKTPRKQGY